MKIAIIGSRNFQSISYIYAFMNHLALATDCPNRCIKIISGGAKGVDTEAIKAAKLYGLETEEYKPNMSAGYDVKQYHIRNNKLIQSADKVVAFWDGESKGTESVILKCLQRKKNIEVIFD